MKALAYRLEKGYDRFKALLKWRNTILALKFANKI